MRLLSILLIPLFVLGHTLPHSHAAGGIVEPDEHAARPHVHLHDHTHDGHHAEDVSAPVDDTRLSADSHDSDAIYIAASGQSLIRSSVVVGLDTQPIDWCTISAAPLPGAPLLRRTSDPLDRYQTLPVYLLIASLRL